jgi:hypothetical protein
MNCESDNESLLADVLAENTPADFRETLLVETLRLARRRRRFRQARRASVLLVALGMLAVLIWQNVPQHSATVPLSAKAGGQSYQLIRSEPLPVSALVATRPPAAGQLIASVETAGVVETMAGSDNFRVINDDELLALASPRPAALVRLGPHSERLIFVNPADEKGFPVD